MSLFILSLLFLPSTCFAMETKVDYYLPSWFVIPFILMLLAIAILPIAIEKWWHSNLNKFWISLALGVPVGIYFGIFDIHSLAEIGLEYFSFIILLLSLFVISGGILLEGDIEATPLHNTVFLLVGAVLASFMGTTGAAMLLIRPLIATNRERKYVFHTVIFFIFVVANIGGCLTPLGDPPLFMGYLMGVPFSWTFNLLPEWAFANTIIILIYFIIDSIMHSKEPISKLAKDRSQIRPLRLRGLSNFPLLAGVIFSVALITKTPYREMVMMILALISWKITKKEYRAKNEFNFGPMIEVAVLFFGIFLTMIPAIVLLRTRGNELGLTEPSHFFWATGSLSSFLDNTPTYVVFFALAQGLHKASEICGMPEPLLKAISLGAVFFGANTYIGNAPNFMVKVIAEDRKIKMPGFFGYMLYSILILIPVFVLIDLIFIR